MKKRRFIVRTVYAKFILLFVGIMWVSSGIAFMLVSPPVLDAIRSGYKQHIDQKAAEIRSFCTSNGVTADKLKSLYDNDDYELSVFSSTDEIKKDSTFGSLVSPSQLQSLSEGNIITGSLKNTLSLPFAAVKTGSEYVIIKPQIKNNMIPYFKSILMEVLLICAGLGSVLIAIASMIIIRPIRRLTAATKEVARGNFDVSVKVTSGDEIGQLTDHFNKMTAELKNIEVLRKDFISNVSHEFKTPIASIQGFAKLIRDKSLTADQFEEYTGIIVSESGRLANLSSNLLRLSKLENQEIRDKFSSFPLDEQIRSAILLLENKWEEKEIDLDLDLDQVDYFGDEELLQQVWINLLSNAVQFSYQKGYIRATLYKSKNKVIAEVEDNGTGIPDEAKSRIFDKFYKADKSRSSEGNGLGLAIVKKIVELHGGSITFVSQVGKGTIFTVELPAPSQKTYLQSEGGAKQ